jgi:S-adenosylmethionine:tRNA ribosyltransferase-isomerase
MNVADFDFDLPEELIAQAPSPVRGGSRLLTLDRRTGAIAHGRVADLPALLDAGDVMVLNNTRVVPARLLGHRVPSGGAVECLLLRRVDDATWDALVHPGQKLRPGTAFRCASPDASLLGEIVSEHTFGRRHVRLTVESGGSIEDVIDRIGHVPLPPYIRRADAAEDRSRYQTVFARVRGSVAAPTAGLHLTTDLLTEVARRGVTVAEITLHVGYGTFKPVRVERVEDHAVDPEDYEIAPAAADLLNCARREGRRIVVVGTTTTRALESAALDGGGHIEPGRRAAGLFIYPGFQFQVVDALLTNFHLPRSSLLMLVSALGGRERVLEAYREAIENRYRFYSYGDAMFIT